MSKIIQRIRERQIQSAKTAQLRLRVDAMHQTQAYMTAFHNEEREAAGRMGMCERLYDAAQSSVIYMPPKPKKWYQFWLKPNEYGREQL